MTLRTFLFILVAALGVSCGQSYVLIGSEGGYTEVLSTEVSPDKELESRISPYRDELADEMDVLLCKNTKAMIKTRPESELGNFVADLCLKRGRALYSGNIDAGLFNTGGLRSSLPEGDIKVGKIFELMPFDNELVVVRIPYEQILAIRDYLIRRGGEPVADMSLSIENGEAKSFLMGGKEIEERDYYIVTSDYLANGGDKMDFFKEGNRVSVEVLGVKIRDAIMDECRDIGTNGKSINTELDGRIKIQD